VGDVEEIVPDDVKQYCTLYGNVKDKNKVADIYQRSDMLILTSLFEGLPIVVMEMMARGKVILSTAVGGIPDYIENNKNGLLITEANEDEIVAKGVEKIQSLIENEPLRKDLGHAAYAYAQKHFSREVFCKTYRDFLGL
jgi:glycosyltransferase involved in cell wall biosynthesis